MDAPSPPSASPERDYEKESLFLCIRDSPMPKSKSPIVAQRQHSYDSRKGQKRRDSGSPTTLLKPTPIWRDLAHLWKHKLNQAKSRKPNHLTDHVHADRLIPVRAEYRLFADISGVVNRRYGRITAQAGSCHTAV